MQKRVFKDLLNYLPAKLLPALTPFITVPIFTHLFTPGEYGTYMLAMGISELLMAATCTGFAAGAVRFYTAYKHRAGLPTYFVAMFLSVGGIVLLAVVLSGLVLVLLRPHIGEDLYALLWAAILTFAAGAWYTTLMHILRAQERSRWYTALELIYRYGTVALNLVFALSLGIIGMLWGQMLASILALVPLLWLLLHGVSFTSTPLARADVRQMWAYALPLTAGNVAFWSLRLADRYSLELFRGTYEVGLYGVSYNIAARSIDLLVGLFLLVPGPIIIRVWEEEGRPRAEEALAVITRSFFLLVIPAVIGLAVTSTPLVRLLAEDSYFEGHHAILLVASASLAFGLGQLGSFGLLLTNRTRALARNQFIATGVSLLLNLLTIPALGFMGAALSACLSFSLVAVLQAVGSARHLTWRWPVRSLLRALAASAVMAVVVAVFLQVSGGHDPAASTGTLVGTTLIAVVGGALIYGGTLWLLGEFSLRHLLRMAAAPSGESTVEALASAKQ